LDINDTQTATGEIPNPAVTDESLVAPVITEEPAPPSPSTTAGMPDEAYKGLQRELAKRDQKVRDLEARVQQMANQPQDAQTAQVIDALVNELAAANPERARQVAQAVQQYRIAAENQRLHEQLASREQERLLTDLEERNMASLREIVSDMGVDPASPLIDYGSVDEYLPTRITKARASARAAATTVKSETPPDRSGDGSHNTQTAAPPSPPATNSVVTEETLVGLQAEYSRVVQTGDQAKIADVTARLRTATDTFSKALFS
jgi:hypothetical protein